MALLYYNFGFPTQTVSEKLKEMQKVLQVKRDISQTKTSVVGFIVNSVAMYEAQDSL